jgi:tyrosyl-tRNA synthetase
VADFLKAGCEVTILFADLHAFLDNMKELETANFLPCFVAFVKDLWMRISRGWFVPY